MAELTPQDAEELARRLEALADDRVRLFELPEPVRRRLLTAAGRLSRPDRVDKRKQARGLRKRDDARVKEHDSAILAETGIRGLRRDPFYVTPPVLPEPGVGGEPLATVMTSRRCYCCKAPYRAVHHFYDQLCPACAELNWQKRHQTADLRGRTALVTGGRVKIGYQAAIKLLRAGARTLVTTRFPNDAARRFAAEPDFAEWGDRLELYGLDLRHTPSVETFARHLLRRESRLDAILHNACQTIRRPPAYYAHLMAGESSDVLSVDQRRLLAGYRELRLSGRGLADAPALSQAVLTAEERSLTSGGSLFPTGQLDADQQQVDLREVNSWRLDLAEVPTIELLEVQLVNAVAPFVLSARLKPLMLRAGTREQHIVNVSAMEGQFYRNLKTTRHPHTNMAKAALNMLTRTSAADYVHDGIHMNSVDTGWVTDEDPAAIAERKAEAHGFHPPLDIVDGAARICDPLFAGLLTGAHAWGVFFKDYRPTPW